MGVTGRAGAPTAVPRNVGGDRYAHSQAAATRAALHRSEARPARRCATGRPHAEAQLLQLSAGTLARRERRAEHAGLLATGLDWDRLALTLRSRGLLTTLGPRIVELACGAASARFLRELEVACDESRRRGALLQLLGIQAIAALAAHGIRASALKGPFLSEAIYADAGRRVSNDIDLLVAPEDLTHAVRVLRGLGYAAPDDHVEAQGRPELHFRMERLDGGPAPLELHWRIHWYEERFATHRLLTPTLDPRGEWRAAPADELAALLLFYARDGFADLRLATDLAAWWDARGERLAPGEIGGLTRAYPALADAIASAAIVAERTVGLPANDILGDSRHPGWRARTAARLARPTPRTSARQCYADIGLIDGLLAPPGGFRRFVARQLLPPRQVLAKQAHDSGRTRAWPPLVRCVGMLGRFAVTLTGLARVPERAVQAPPHGRLDGRAGRNEP
jgi:hypothetical protein